MSELEALTEDETEVTAETPEQFEEELQKEDVKKAEAEDTQEAEDETGEEDAAPPADDQVNAFKAKALDETKKRQAIEAELEQMRGLIQQTQQGQQGQQANDFWSDPEGALNRYAQNMQQQMQRTRTDLAVEMMRELHDDYDEAEARFIDMAKADPTLVDQMNQAGNPARFAYEHVKKTDRLQQVSDPNFMDNLREQVRAEIEAEQKAKLEQDIASRLPGTLSDARATGGNSNISAHESLSDILGR